MCQSLLCLEDIKGFCQERLVSDILLLALSCDSRRILRNHLRTMDNVHYKFIHFHSSLSGISISL